MTLLFDPESTVIVMAEKLEWRCTACLISPLLAIYTELGGVHVRVAGRHGNELHYVYDLTGGSIKAHCPACHAWRELYYDRVTETVSERECSGSRPKSVCKHCSKGT